MPAPLRIALLLSLSLVLLPACYEPGGPVPEDPLDPALRVPVPQQVVVEDEFVYAPYPRDNGEIPAGYSSDWDCDSVRFLRYRPDTGGAPKEVDAVLVLIPGYMGGANSFNYLGRQLVSMAEQAGTGSLEVWAVDRRANCLEDVTGLNAAEEAADPQVAVDYYYGGGKLDGRTFQGFLGEPDAPFLSEFGLKLLMNDVWSIVTAKIPDPADRRKTVFIGGHSAGGGFASFFAGWDFDGDKATDADAGYANCAGLIGLDGPVGPRSESILTEAEYDQHLTAIRDGTEARLGLFTGVTPEALALFEIAAMNAHLSPQAESTLDQIPYSQEVASLLRMLHSRDLGHFIVGVPAVGDFRYSNEALFGALLDDNFNPVPFMEASMGFLRGGSVVAKSFPGDLGDLVGLPGLKKDGMFIPWDAGAPFNLGTGPLYSWVNFDQVGEASDPAYQDTTGALTYTTWTEEVSDIQDVALSLYQGASNFPEWYYTSRIGLDSKAATTAYNGSYGLNFFHNDRIADLPFLNINAADHPGYNHLDVLYAAVDRPSHRENEVFAPLMDFVLENSGGTVLVP
jgi:hypothetical protein